MTIYWYKSCPICDGQGRLHILEDITHKRLYLHCEECEWGWLNPLEANDPAKAIGGAYKVLKAGGQIMILDLLKHNFERAHELYGDRWLGFAESDLHRWLEGAGFKKIEVSVVAREEQPPHFETVLASGQR